MGLYFICDPFVGARRTLGYAATGYDTLTDLQRADVDALVAQINERNRADRIRSVQPIVPPHNSPTFVLPEISGAMPTGRRFMATIDTSADLDKRAMADPILRLVSQVLAA